VRNRRLAALALMIASGFAGLGYQIVWTQQSALWLGHESAGVLAVVAGFFGGLALGALLIGPRVHRSHRPARWYAGCEVAIGVWSLALALLFDPVSAWLLNLIGPQPSAAWHWSVAFCGTFLLLLPATAAMGATLPAMERVFRSIPALYAGNTFGAVLGVLGAAFWLVPQFGLTKTAAVCAALNFLCAVLALTMLDSATPESSTTAQPGARRIQMLLAATGLLGISYEVLVVRVLSQVAENTVYTFAILLAVYLVGTAIGAALYSRTPSMLGERARLLRALAALCLLGTLGLAASQPLKNAVLHALGTSMSSALIAEAVLALVAFLPPTIVMGALFSHLSTRAAESGISFGRAIGINTAGAALAPFVCGVLLVTHVGAKLALLLVAAGYLALSSRSAWRTSTQWAAVAMAAAFALWAPSLMIVDVPDGGRLVSYAEGTMGTVSVVEDAAGVATLHIDNRQQEGSSATTFADARQAWLPILLHPAPHRALFLGLGTGVTARSATADPALDVDAVELLPEVIEASSHFTGAVGQSANERLHVMAGDARRFVRASHEHYDVIVADNFHPARSGSGALYTVEHFSAVRARLTPDGLFCQWLPLHQLDLDTLRSIVRSFVTVFPNADAILATNSLETPVVGLVAQGGDALLDVRRIRARLTDAAVKARAAELGLGDDLAVLGTFIAGPHALERFAGDAPINTDDRPVVAYRAPRLLYASDSLPRDRLLDLLHQVDIGPAEIVGSADADWNSRLSAYWSARDRFIEVGRGVQPTSDVQRMLSQVREPLLEVLRISPDFRPAYDPLLRMASALNERDPDAARALLADLARVRPSITAAQ
jgi:spermidine synthase